MSNYEVSSDENRNFENFAHKFISCKLVKCKSPVDCLQFSEGLEFFLVLF